MHLRTAKTMAVHKCCLPPLKEAQRYKCARPDDTSRTGDATAVEGSYEAGKNKIVELRTRTNWGKYSAWNRLLVQKNRPGPVKSTG
jgi:hypothetical protein